MQIMSTVDYYLGLSRGIIVNCSWTFFRVDFLQIIYVDCFLWIILVLITSVLDYYRLWDYFDWTDFNCDLQ